jgi:hypothetical protein
MWKLLTCILSAAGKTVEVTLPYLRIEASVGTEMGQGRMTVRRA